MRILEISHMDTFQSPWINNRRNYLCRLRLSFQNYLRVKKLKGMKEIDKLVKQIIE
jgi:hypothetical protein